ncbi:MAG: hypothetical protein J1F65_00595 [Clostridiales bacterium]|nr:hypothetical protein [Clostridiales bacterium]
MRKFCRITISIAVCLLAILLCLSLFGCQTNIDANRRRNINSISHRGYSDAPENTLAAFRLSKEMGFDMVECDVRFTKDGKPVLLHDGTVNRTSDGKGKISELSFDEVRRMDFGSWKGQQYAGERIPTFEEFISLCVELELYPYVEIKDISLQQVQTLVDIVNKTELSVTWIGRDVNLLACVAQLRSGQDRVGLIAEIVTKDILKFLSDLTEYVDVFVDCNYLTLTNTQLNLCKRYRIPLEVWTVNTKEIIENIDPYITGVTSDSIIAQEVFNSL